MISYYCKEKEYPCPFLKVTVSDSKRTIFFQHPISVHLDPSILQTCSKCATLISKPEPEIPGEERVSNEVLVYIPDFSLHVAGIAEGSPVIRVSTSELTISASEGSVNVSFRHLSVFAQGKFPIYEIDLFCNA